MASKKTIGTENLVRLGAERLASILLELAGEQPAVKRRLRLELAGEAGGEIIAAEISKRITTLRSTRSFIDWQKRPDFVRDLERMRATIVERAGQTRPDLALDLMWRFMALAEPVINRVDDSSGTVGGVFRAACDDIGTLAVKVKPDPHVLAERVLAAVMENEYGEFDNLVRVIFPALGDIGVATLRAGLTASIPKRRATDRYDGEAATVRRALQDLADGEGDVDAYIALVPSEDRMRPAVAIEIGRRLLTADRAEEAVAALDAATPKKRARRDDLDDDLHSLCWEGPDADWESAYIDALEATGQAERAQQLRWAAFEKRLSTERLRAYLKALPDFEDVVAEERAMEHALGFSSFSTALHFLHAWPAHRQAGQLVLERHAGIDGNLYYLLDPAARWLEGTHPLAATLLRRAMIEDTLEGAKSKRYRHAARHLAECQSLASLIGDHDQFEMHEAFVARMRARQGAFKILGACCDWGRFWAHGKWVALVGQLVWRVKLVAEVRPGVVTETELARIERDEDAGLADLGLQLAEVKQLAAALQAQIVPAQVAVVGEHRRSCGSCGRPLASKGRYPVTFRSLFGDVPVRVRRLLVCPCQGLGKVKSFGALDLGHDAVAPELAYITARYAALAPFGKVAVLLSELLPLSGAQNAGTVRNRTRRVGENVVRPHAAETATQAETQSAGPVVVGLDGGYVRSRHRQEERHFEVIAGKVVDAAGTQHRFAFVRDGQAASAEAFMQALAAAGVYADTPATVLCDGDAGLWRLQRETLPDATVVLDWWHVAVRFEHALQTARGLGVGIADGQQLADEAVGAIDRAKWRLWHGCWTGCRRKLTGLYRWTKRKPMREVAGIDRLQRHISELLGYLERNEDTLVHYAARRRCDEPISTAFVESAVNEIVAKRMNKKQQMRWNRATVQPFLDVRTAVLNDTLENAFRHRYPGFRSANDDQVVSQAA